jgi:F420-dependent oxidoreductase-like protein
MAVMLFGVSIWPQYTTWEAMRHHGPLVEKLGYDYLFTWDHFMPIVGHPDGPNLECWQILSAWAMITSRVKIGALVSGNTYRHPTVLANMAATLDHISGGRAILGLGGGWFEHEHTAYGLPFDTVSIRLAKLAEAANVCRSLLDQPTSTFAGQYYQLQHARCEPKPVQKRLPLMVGGSGERKTLRVVAEQADMWNGTFAPAAEFGRKVGILKEHCAAVGRDFNAIQRTLIASVIIRDKAEDVVKAKQAFIATNRLPAEHQANGLFGTVEEVTQQIKAYADVGLQGLILRGSPPYDEETWTRLISEVKPRL